MDKVLVMTDSVSGISKELASRYNIKVVPAAYIVFDGKFYADGDAISTAEAYALLEKDPDKFSASTLTPAYLLERFLQAKQETNKIIFIHFASALSGAYKIACMAANILQEESPETDIRVIDSKTAAGAQGLLAIAAANAAAEGATTDEVVSFVDKLRQKTGGIMMLNTLRYVYRTGRMSKTAARLASFLSIRPINRMTDEGTLEVIDKVRKREDGYQRLIKFIRREAGTDDLHFLVLHAAAPEIGERFCELLEQNFNCLNLEMGEYSPIMGYATGRGAIFIGFHPSLNLFK